MSRWFMAALAGGAIVWVGWALLSPLVPDPDPVAAGAALVTALFGLHKLAQWAESRGWIYYQKRQGSWDAVGAALSEVHQIYRPGERYVKELKDDVHVHEEDDDVSGAGSRGGDRPAASSRGAPRPSPGS
ncbi:MAG: hypothetical protein IT177_04450 [Acidobacteria bacterium]|nr:hypothetical protein [Acidobacteriota bacterium]